MKKPGSLVRPSIARLVPYSSARDEFSGTASVYLDANENPYNGPYNRYPDPHQLALKEKVGRIKNIDPGNIFLGNGSDEAIDILFRIFCEPGKDNVVAISPSYGMYRVCADINNVEYIPVPLEQDFSLNSDRLKAAVNQGTKMVFICSPNNPTANSFDPDEILALAEELDVILVVDEAYIDFSSNRSLKSDIITHPNLVILQTFSKAWGLAGIRLGMAFANQEIIELMSRVKYPYNLNILTLEFADKELDKHAQVEEWIRIILEERKKLSRAMKKFRFVEKVYPTDANFLLVRVRKARKVYQYLVENNIIVRDCSNVELCDGSLRITVGSPEENKILLDKLWDYQRDFVETCDL